MVAALAAMVVVFMKLHGDYNMVVMAVDNYFGASECGGDVCLGVCLDGEGGSVLGQV